MIRSTTAILSVALFVSLARPLPALTPPPTPPGGRVFIFSCTVMFATKSSGSSETRPGFGEDRASRSEVSVLREFNISGQDSSAYQRMTDRICADAPAELAAAGYEVVSEGVQDHYAYKRSLGSGQASPQRQGRSGTSYLVFAPSGQPIMDEFVVGATGAAGLMWGYATTGKKLGANPVSLLYAVDFASIDEARTRRGAGQNTASVKANLEVAVGLTVTNYDVSDARCSVGSPFGEYRNMEFCGLRRSQLDRAYSLPDTAERRTKDPIVNVEETTGAAAVGTAAFNAAMTVLRMGGGGGGGTINFKRFAVTVDPAKYETAAIEGARGLIAPAMTWINDPASRPRRGRR